MNANGQCAERRGTKQIAGHVALAPDVKQSQEMFCVKIWGGSVVLLRSSCVTVLKMPRCLHVWFAVA